MGSAVDDDVRVIDIAHETPFDTVVMWLTVVFLLLAVAWLLIGMLSARTRLVRRPGAAAARATWIASTRPWRARESTLGMLLLDRVLLIVVPAGLLVVTRALQTGFLSWTFLLLVFSAWAIFALVARALVGAGRSPYPLMAAVGGVVVLRCILTLLGALIPIDLPVIDGIIAVVGAGLFLWAFVAGGWAIEVQFGARRAIGIMAASIGAGLAVPSLVIAAVGFDRLLALWRSEMGVLPPGFEFAAGIKGPDVTAWVAAGAGVVLLVVGLVLSRRPAGSVTR